MRRLTLAGLPRSVRTAAWVGLVATAVTGVVTVVVSLRWAAPGPARPAGAAADPGAGVAAWALLCAAVTAGLLVAAAVLSKWRLRRALLMLPALTGASLCAVISMFQLREAVALLAVGAATRWGVAVVQGSLALGVVAGLVVAVAPWKWLAAKPWHAAGLAALPFAVPVPAMLEGAAVLPGVSPQVARATLGLMAVVLAAPLGVWSLWLAVEGARLTRDSAVWALGRTRPARLLGVLLTVKGSLLVAGYANVRWRLVDDFAAGWEGSARFDGLADWALAALFAAAALALVRNAHRAGVRERPAMAAGLLTITLFCLPLVLLALVDLLLIAVAQVDLLWALGAGFSILTATAVVAALRLRSGQALVGVISGVGAVVAALVLGLGFIRGPLPAGQLPDPVGAFPSALAVLAMAVLIPACVLLGVALLRHAMRSAGLFLLVFAVWALPRAMGVLLAPGSTVPGTIDPVTFDTAITGAAVVAWALWRRGSSWGVAPEALFVLLSVVTATVATQLLIPASVALRFFSVGLLVPIAVQFSLDARGLNEPVRDRPARVLAAIGMACGALTWSLLLIAAGLLQPSTELVTRLAPVLFAVPFAIPLVMAALGTQPGAPTTPAAPSSPGRRRQ